MIEEPTGGRPLPRGGGAASVKGDPVTPSGWWLLPAAVVAIWVQIIAWLIS